MEAENKSRLNKLDLPKNSHPIRLGIVGGASGGFIGPVHAMAARMDNRYRIVAGALSSRAEVAKSAGAEWFIDPERCYTDYKEMARIESQREDGIEAVAITTPNFTHFDIAKKFLEAGIHVICDKPMTTSLEDAIELEKIAKDSGLCFMVPHVFSAYAMVRQAKSMVTEGLLGDIRLVHVEFMMDWLTNPIEQQDAGQGNWRTDPSKSGPGGGSADIGTHAWHLAQFITGQKINSVLAQVEAIVPNRRLDDNVQVLTRFENGARGTILVSQVAPGNDCEVRVRIYGSKGSVEWNHNEMNKLRYTSVDQPTQIISRGDFGLSKSSYLATWLPKGHPEGYIEGFAQLYSEFAVAIESHRTGEKPEVAPMYSDINDGVSGVLFVESILKSHNNGNVWVSPADVLASHKKG